MTDAEGMNDGVAEDPQDDTGPLWSEVFADLEIEPVSLLLGNGEVLRVDRSAVVGIFMDVDDDGNARMTGALLRGIGRVDATDILTREE